MHTNSRDLRRTVRLPALLAGIALLSACTSSTDSDGSCGTLVDLFPVPVSDETTPFGEVDDGYLEVAFHADFSFPFYDDDYESVFLNTNGGMTFGEGTDYYDMAASDIEVPGIAVFWGDMDATEGLEETPPANQMRYEACADRFVVRYEDLQDNDEYDWKNSAVVTLHEDGRIVIEYGDVLSEDILVGIWDGTHTDDRYSLLASSYANTATMGTATLLFDYWSEGPAHAGELSGMTITYNP